MKKWYYQYRGNGYGPFNTQDEARVDWLNRRAKDPQPEYAKIARFYPQHMNEDLIRSLVRLN